MRPPLGRCAAGRSTSCVLARGEHVDAETETRLNRVVGGVEYYDVLVPVLSSSVVDGPCDHIRGAGAGRRKSWSHRYHGISALKHWLYMLKDITLDHTPKTHLVGKWGKMWARPWPS